MRHEIHDVFVIGGGINGCGIARDAAGRGYSVALAEMNDFASGTSSGATKLIHAELRYLEHYEFRLVRESLMERETLWAMAPHIIWPMRFVLPYHKGGIRPAWLIRLGLFLYDHLSGRKLLLDMRVDPAAKPLKPLFTKAFEYSDGWVVNARMVVLNEWILPRTKVVSARQENGRRAIETVETGTGRAQTHQAPMLVNAVGPWVDRVIREAMGNNDAHHARLVQSSHILLKKKFWGSLAYFLQNQDNRNIFAIPYQSDFTLIGTTDRDDKDDPKGVQISQEETAYLCNAASDYFREPATPHDIVWTYPAVRPLYDDAVSQAQEATRDYVLKLFDGGNAPLLNVFGGKLTTYRRLSEHAPERIAEAIGTRGQPWTAKSHLPGGGFAAQGYEAEFAKLRGNCPFLTKPYARRLVRRYGTCTKAIVGKATGMEDLGRHFGSDPYESEVKYLIDREWAMNAEGVLRQRTKYGLRVTEEEAKYVEEYMAARPARMAG